MTLSIKRIIALLTALLVLLCPMALAEDTAEDTTVFAKLGDIEVPLTPVLSEYSYYADLYVSYGLEDQLDQLKQDIADAYIKHYLILDYAAKNGLDVFTDEEIAAWHEQAQADYDDMASQYRDYFAEDGMTDEEVDQAVANYFAQYNYTVEVLENNSRETEILNRFSDVVTADVAVTDDDVQAYYDELLASQQEAYTADASAYETDNSNGEIITYVPAGYRSVFHILLALSEDDQYNYYYLKSDIATVEADMEVDGADTEALTVQKASYEQQIDAMVAPLLETAAEIQVRLDEGEDFMTLLAEYGEDPGMEVEPYKTNGYYVSDASTGFESNFKEGAMALAAVGDISEPVITNYGVHLIYYAADVPEGPVALETLSAQIEETLLADMQDEAYQAAVQALYDEATVDFINYDLLVSESETTEDEEVVEDAEDEDADDTEETED